MEANTEYPDMQRRKAFTSSLWLATRDTPPAGVSVDGLEHVDQVVRRQQRGQPAAIQHDNLVYISLQMRRGWGMCAALSTTDSQQLHDRDELPTALARYTLTTSGGRAKLSEAQRFVVSSAGDNHTRRGA